VDLLFKQDFLTLRYFLKEAVQRRGKPKMLYTDNAKIYRTQQLALICAGFRMLSSSCPTLSHAAAKGSKKILLRTVRTRFLSTINTDINLEELNRALLALVGMKTIIAKSIALWVKAL